jgi:hypothetical protein
MKRGKVKPPYGDGNSTFLRVVAKLNGIDLKNYLQRSTPAQAMPG